jgi:DNA (cytosine-5)-methyltransferase 1
VELSKLCKRLRSEDPERLLAADLFAGAGGLSLGLEQSGIQVVLSIDHDASAVETHRHHFPGMTVDWDLADPNVIDRVARLMIENEIDVLAGGPPCQPFSKAGRSLMRHQVRTGVREAHDVRRDLWRSYLEIIRMVRPRAVIMENVPDMALDREMFILRSMVLELERMGYGVEVKVLDTWRYGVPQFRQRLILVALEEGKQFNWPEEISTPVSLDDAISDLPPVEGGWRPPGGAEGWSQYEEPITSFQRLMRKGVAPEHQHRVYDHITRPVRDDDKDAFALMDSSTRYSDLPEEFKRYRDDIFDDKYKRLDGTTFSRTITAHIAKDGYWYIHPQQDRTITVREAARIQTFPDWFRFSGPPSAAFRQIGNAVPPRAGRAVGEGVVQGLSQTANSAVRSEEISQALAQWFEEQSIATIPWLRAESRWQALVGERLLDRASLQNMRTIWPLLQKHINPASTLEHKDELLLIAEWMDRQTRAEAILELAGLLDDMGSEDLSDTDLDRLVSEKMVPKSHADMAALAVGAGGEDSSEEPVITNKGVLRVAARFVGQPVDLTNRLTDGRLAVARMIGFGECARAAHLALMDLANGVCKGTPQCQECPLQDHCNYAQTEHRGSALVLDLSEEPERAGQVR